MRRPLPPLNSLRAFEAAARLSSFSRAADELCLTPSAVGQSVRALERWLGTRLFVRDSASRSLALTAAGRAYLVTVSQALDTIVDATDVIRQTEIQRDTLAVCSRPAFALHWLLSNVVEFQRQNLNLEVHISTRDAGTPSELNDTADLSIGYGRPGDWAGSALEAAPLLFDKLTPMMSRELAAKETLVSPADLGHFPMIGAATAVGDWEEWMAAVGLPQRAADVAVGLTVADRSLAIQAAVAGYGVALCDKHLVAPLVSAGQLFAPFPDLLLERGTAHCLIWTRRRGDEPKIRSFRTWITNRCAAWKSNASGTV